MDATISLTGRGKEGTVSALKMTTGGECLLLDISTELVDMHGSRAPYEKSRLYLHGSVESIRDFAEQIIAALPDENTDPQPVEAEKLTPAVSGAILAYAEALEATL